MITLALSKGRIFDETLPLLKAAGIEVLEDPEKSRKLILPTNQANVRVVLVRASDVPTYVEYGGADLGNYAITDQNTAMANIGQAALTMTAQNASKLVGQADPTFNINYSGFVNGETSTVLGGTLAIARTDTATPATAAGTYTVLRPSGLTAANYNIGYADGDLTRRAEASRLRKFPHYRNRHSGNRKAKGGRRLHQDRGYRRQSGRDALRHQLRV